MIVRDTGHEYDRSVMCFCLSIDYTTMVHLLSVQKEEKSLLSRKSRSMKKKKKGLNSKALPNCSLAGKGTYYSRRLVSFSSPEGQGQTPTTFVEMEHYLHTHDAEQIAYRPVSYYDPESLLVLYAIVPDTKHVWNLLRCQAPRYGLIGKKLEREGSIPPLPQDLPNSELHALLAPLLDLLIGEPS